MLGIHRTHLSQYSHASGALSVPAWFTASFVGIVFTFLFWSYPYGNPSREPH